MYREITDGIQVDVEPAFVPERSDPERNYFFFDYKISIKNIGQTTAQLINRHWVITDGNGKVEHVRGPGVVGEQPTLEPGQEFEYISHCPLSTPTGNMRGIYGMQTPDGKNFEVKIPLFFLRDLRSLH